MSIKPNGVRMSIFFAVAIVSLVLHFLMFELRYMWYLSPADARFLRIGYLIFATAIIALWIFLPSRLLVATISFVCFLFPPLLRGDRFPSLLAGEVPGDGGIVGFVLFSVLLLVIATELRRRIKIP